MADYNSKGYYTLRPTPAKNRVNSGGDKNVIHQQKKLDGSKLDRSE